MKKMLLAIFLLAFAGIGLAEPPTIVNPPRPTRDFKWLFVIDYNTLGRYYVYTNDFSTEDFEISQNIKGYDLIFSGDQEDCWDTVETRSGATCGSQNTSPLLRHILFGSKDVSGKFTQYLRVLKAKAPKPEFLPAQKNKKPKVQKAKVVFTK